MYLKSNVDQRLKIYEQKLASKEREITKKTPVEKSPSTPPRDGTVDGDDAWEIQKLWKSRTESDGTKSYYGRWKSSYKDEWFHESQLKGTQGAIDDFENSKKVVNKKKKTSQRIGDIPLKRLHPSDSQLAKESKPKKDIFDT